MSSEDYFKEGNRKCQCNALFFIEKSEKIVHYGRGGMINRFLKTHTKTQIRFWVRCSKCQKGYFVSDKKRNCIKLLEILNP